MKQGLLMKLDNKIDYSEFLNKLKILDYKKEPWNNFKIPHGLSVSEKKDFWRRKIKETIGKEINGIYLYEKGGKVLYIGKGKPICNRVYKHFRESFEKVSGDTKYNRWHQFFSNKKNTGELTVYWIEINAGNEENSELDRQIIEKIYTKIYKPKFDEFEPSDADFWLSKKLKSKSKQSR